jgi:hypothetical protein
MEGLENRGISAVQLWPDRNYRLSVKAALAEEFLGFAYYLTVCTLSRKFLDEHVDSGVNQVVLGNLSIKFPPQLQLEILQGFFLGLSKDERILIKRLLAQIEAASGL